MVSSFLDRWNPFLPSFSPEDKGWKRRLLSSAGLWEPALLQWHHLLRGCLFPKCGLFLALVFPGRLGCMWVKGAANVPHSGGKNPVSATRGPGSSTYRLPDLGQMTELSTSVNEVLGFGAYGGSSNSAILIMSNAWSLVKCVRQSLETGTNMGLSSF